MNSIWIKNIIRTIILILIQVLILKRVEFGWERFNYFSFFVYPLAIMLLPIRIPKIGLLFLGFVLGLIIDMFYDSPGVHAAACVFIAYMRPHILTLLEPRGGYPTQAISPTRHRFGSNWFFTYSAIILFLFMLVYFIAEVFSYSYALEITLKIICSFIVSYVCIVIYFFLVNPKE